MRRNLEAAARHPRVEQVWGVAASEGTFFEQVKVMAAEVTSATGKLVDVFTQDRIGSLRAGKGDAMNTALARAAGSGFDRIHFYDADITNFDDTWIDGAETAADHGFEVVRHRFPRASTDAMITWMITRPSLAMLFPGTILPRIGQPLGGELLITRDVARALASNRHVKARSDWGIDTIITYFTTALGVPMYEHNVSTGKRHSLYGSLEEIRDMVIECLDAAQSLAGMPAPSPGSRFSADPPATVPEDLRTVVGYDVHRTTPLLTKEWSDRESLLAADLGPGLADRVLANRDRPSYAFMDESVWGDVLAWLLERFRMGDPPWESLAFRLWLMRVLAYTEREVPKGYDSAISHLEEAVLRYEKRWMISG